jgi:hypothetical protein
MYIGNDLQIAHPSYKIIDDISSGFNGSTTSFALQVSGATPVPFPISTQQVMISVNGVVQEPDPNGGAGFKLLGSNIVFSSAPANGHAFFGVINAGADYVTAGSEFPDGSATAPSFTFQDDQDTGWFRNASGDVGYSSNGSAILNFDGNGLTIAAGKGLTVDTSTLKVDAANNRVGIGLTTPQVPLHLDGANTRIQFTAPDTGSAAGDGVILGLNGDEDFFINNRESSKNLLFFTVNAERMRIDSSGRLLLGTTTEGHTSADDLTIATSGTTGITIRSGTSDVGNLFFSDGTSGDAEYKGYVQYQHSSNLLELGSNGTTALTLDSSQNATFAGQIKVGTVARIESTGEYKAPHGTAGTPAFNFLNDNDNGMYRITTNTIGFSTAGTEALRLDGSQNATFAGDVTLTGGSKLVAGSSAELEIYHSTYSRIAADDLRIVDKANGHGMITAAAGGAVGLRYANNQKLATTNTGVSVTGTVSDSKGNVRKIPYQDETGSTHTLVATDSDKVVGANNGVTIPASVLGVGDAVTIICHSSSDITLTQGSGLTLYNTADGTTGNRTLAARGMATIYFVSGTIAYISGAGLS